MPFLLAPLALGLLLLVPAQLAAGEDGRRESSEDAAPLLSLFRATGNWAEATAAAPGAAWDASSIPGAGGLCGPDPGGGAWLGVTCRGGRVVELDLSELRLAGTLPAQLAALSSLERLNLSGNEFAGGVPLAWLQPGAFASLREVNLSSNQLSGPLPPSWAALPQLRTVHLEGNAFNGNIPVEYWSLGSPERPFSLTLRPGNPALCGPVVPVASQLYLRELLPSLASVMPQLPFSTASQMRTGDRTTSLLLWHAGLLSSDAQVTLTNWLGSCMRPCAAGGAPPYWVQQAGLPWPPAPTTNLFDLSWQYNMSIADLAALNVAGASSAHGNSSASLALPCYPDSTPQFGYYGGDVAFGQFSGGHQAAGVKGVGGAMTAARVNGGLTNRNNMRGTYVGSVLTDGSGVVAPAWWFVDLQATLQISSVVMAAGQAMTNVSLYIGSDASSVQANKLVAAGLSIAAGHQLAVPAGGDVGRHVIVYTGAASQGTMALDSVQVYAFETNAAAGKPVHNAPPPPPSAGGSSRSSRSSGSGSSSPSLQALTDGDPATCVLLHPGSDGAALVVVDLGYTGPVGAVALAAGSGLPAGAAAHFTVHPDPAWEGAHGADVPAVPGMAGAGRPCGVGDTGVALAAGAWSTQPCNQTGRFVAVRVAAPASSDAIELCELHVHLLLPPSPAGAGSSSSAYSRYGRALAPLLTAVAAAALGALLLSYAHWRGQRLRQVRAKDEAAAAAARHQLRCSLLAYTQGRLHTAGYGSAEGSPASSEGHLSPAATGVPSPLKGSGTGAGSTATAAAAEAASDVPSPFAAGAAAAAAAAQTSSGSGVGSLLSHGGSPLTGTLATSGSATPRRHSELQLVEEFIRSMFRHGSSSSRSKKSSASSNSTSQGSLPRPAAGLPIAPAGAVAASDLAAAATDITKLPPGFAEVSPAEICLIKVLGEGSFGEVWLATYCDTLVAVKVMIRVKGANMTASLQHQAAIKSLKAEATLMSNLVHPNVCRYLGACTSDSPSLIMEYCSRRSLDTLLSEALRSPKMREQLPWTRLLRMMLDAASGMRYLHTRTPPVAHRDFKSANLLVDADWHVKVADFNLSRPVETRASTVLMTNPRWLAPCVLSGLPGQLAADIWAFGTVMWEVMTWCLPFEELNAFQIISVVQQQGADSLPPPPNDQLPAGPLFVYGEYVALLRECRNPEPDARPTFTSIVPRLKALVDKETQARQPPVVAEEASSKGPQMSLRLPTEGPAYKAAIAELHRRRAALQKRGSDSSSGSGGGRELLEAAPVPPAPVQTGAAGNQGRAGSAAAAPASPSPMDIAGIGRARS